MIISDEDKGTHANKNMTRYNRFRTFGLDLGSGVSDESSLTTEAKGDVSICGESATEGALVSGGVSVGGDDEGITVGGLLSCC